jgi:hypothetical protein
MGRLENCSVGGAPSSLQSCLVGNRWLFPREAKAIAFTQGIRLSDVRNYDITPDGKFVALVDPREPGVSGTSLAPEIQVVLNWFEELKQRVPTH